MEKMADSPYAFISYSRHDSEVVDRMARRLLEFGVNVWRDTWEIRPGEQWAHSIERALAAASAYVYVASKNTSVSGWVEHELQSFLNTAESATRVVPVLVDDEGEARLPTFLRLHQWVDLRSDFDAGVRQLAAALLGTIPRQFPGWRPSPQARTKGYVFISYAESDSAFVEELKEFLEKREYGYWDFDNSERDYQVQFFLELEDRIREALGTLSVLSPSWKASKWTTKEYLYSEEIGVPVFLLRAQEMEPTLLVAGVPFIDFVADKESGFSRLERELRRRGL